MDEKIIIEAYREVCEKNKEVGIVPGVKDVVARIAYNIDAKAYEFIYGISTGNIRTEEVIKILEKYKMSYSYENRLHNSAQNKLI